MSQITGAIHPFLQKFRWSTRDGTGLETLDIFSSLLLLTNK